MSNCKVCKLEIHSEAVKCPSCGSFQNWRRKLNISAAILSLILAILSVIAVGLPPILDRLEEQHKETIVAVSVSKMDATGLITFVQNHGDGYIAIGGAELTIEAGSEVIKFEPVGPFEIAPKSSKLVIFKQVNDNKVDLPIYIYNWEQDIDKLKHFSLKVFHQGTNSIWNSSVTEG